MYDYAKRLAEYGDSPAAVGYRRETQLARFEELSGIGDMRGASILDLGCGLCHLFDFLAPRGISGYVGVDIVPQLLAEADRRMLPLPGKDSTRTVCADILEFSSAPNSFDYVMMNGIFNEERPSKKEMFMLIGRAFTWARKGVAFNFLSTQTAMPDPDLQYHGPVSVRLECANMTRSLRMNCCYMLPSCDTSVFLYKENA